MLEPYYQAEGVTIYHGDSPQIMAQLAAESIDMIWTDPPYGHSNNAGDLQSRLRKTKGGLHARTIANDRPDEFRLVFNAAMVQAVRVLKRDSCISSNSQPSANDQQHAMIFPFSGADFSADAAATEFPLPTPLCSQ